MSLFGTLNQSANALRVAQLGLQVVGNNVANANTPGYLRQELVQAAAGANRIGGLVLGNGVEALGVIQKVDYALATRLRNATGDLQSNQRVLTANQDLEQILGSLEDSDFGTELSEFNNTLHELYNRPQDMSQRQLVVLRGTQLADHVRALYDRGLEGWRQANAEVGSAAPDINRLTRKIALLNNRIVDIEGGRTLGSDATGLRDERLKALDELGQLVNITVQEQDRGSVNVFVGGDYLVADGNSRDVISLADGGNPDSGYSLVIKDSGAVLDINKGRIGGAATARDEVYTKFLGNLDELASSLARVFNEVHTQGQGGQGFTDLTSAVGLNDTAAPLSTAGLDFRPQDGTFEINVYDKDKQLIRTQRITVSVDGPAGPMGIDDIADQISAVPGLSAEVTDDGRLRIRSTSAQQQFSFGQDTSGFLAAMGINTFFVGNSALTIDVNTMLQDNPQLLAVSRGGLGEDSKNLEQLVDIFQKTNTLLGNQSFQDQYEGFSTRVTQDVSVQKAATSGIATYQSTLQSDFLSGSGVSIDEEAIKMISYQRAFQASSKVISVVSELLETLVSL